jgi:hypothetical protein
MALVQKRVLRQPHPLFWVALTALGTAAQSVPLAGTGAALILVVLAQVYLPGWLLARALGKNRVPHPIARWAWILAGGLGLTITLGSAVRVLGISVPIYLLILHAIMFVLALLPPGSASAAEHAWQPTRHTIPLYILLASCLAVAIGVSFQSRYRFWGFEDQPIFIGQIEWMASLPYQQPPGGLPLLSRQISVAENHRGDTRLASDGWTYTHAAWVWASGVPASQLIWYDLTALFIWAGPLIAFAMAFEVTGRETAGAWAATALIIAGLFTADGLVYTPNYEAFGRLSVFQVNTLRFFTLTTLLPLALTIGLGYLRAPRLRDLIFVALIAAALAFVHPFGITLFAAAIGSTTILTIIQTIKQRTNQHQPSINSLFFLLVITALLLIIPFAQKLDRSGLGDADSIVQNTASGQTTSNVSAGFISLTLPILGGTYIREPQAVFYHPIIALAAALSLLAWIGWRQHLAARYIAASVTVMLLIAFLPGLTAFVNRFMSTVGLYTTTFLLPVTLVLGLLLERLAQMITSRIPRYASGIMPLLAISWMLTTLIEPFPIPMSARDEITGFNTVQAVRRTQPYQMELITRLRELLPLGQVYVVTTPYSVSNLLTEELTGVFITGGRPSRNRAYVADARIYTTLEPIAPWWDSDDVAFIQEYGVTHLILEATDTRLPQALINSTRFTLLDTIEGYFIFAVHADVLATENEKRFQQMNALYSQLTEPRWSKFGFNPERAGSDSWLPVIADWEDQPTTTETRLGLAFSFLMANRDADALPIWEELRTGFPDVPLFAQATSHARYAIQPERPALQPLLDALSATNPISRVMAARSLFDAQLFYLLTGDELAQVISVANTDSLVWHQLAVLDRPEQVRRRAGLLMNAAQWAGAAAELNALPAALLAPQDMMSLAALRLVQRDRAGAITVLQQASDPDWVAAQTVLHRDRWETNPAAQWAAQLQQEQSAPPPSSLWNVADSGRLYALLPDIDRNTDERTLNVSAWFGGPKPFADPYPFQTWRFQVIDPTTGQTYALEDVPAESSADTLVQANVTLQLPADLPELTTGHLVITPRYDSRIFAQPLIVPLSLNRPEAAQPPSNASAIGVLFGDKITLDKVSLEATADHVEVHLYWLASNAPTEDYQIFVHVYDSAGNQVLQDDSAPVHNRYPTSQWRVGILIDDPHILSVSAPLPSGDYTVQIGLYRLENGTRLAVTPSERALDNSLPVATFTVP